MKYVLSIGVVVLLLTGIWLAVAPTHPLALKNQSVAAHDLTKLPAGELTVVQPSEVVVLQDGDTFDLEASIVEQVVGNRTIKRLAYNGQIPGPVLKVEKGASITVNFTNHIDMDTSVHSHGLRGDWHMDGAVPITPPVGVGETFSYTLTFPDTGIFWYHPHVREDYQQELGLYGNFIVEEDGYWGDADQEAYLIVDDMLTNGTFNDAYVTNALMGRYGDRLLINDQTNYQLTVNQGEVVRTYITNVANTRTFDLTFTGADMKLVGGDVGRVEHEKIITHQIIAPAERYVLELYYREPGRYAIEHRGKKIGTVTVLPSNTDHAAQFATLRNNNDDYATIRSDEAVLLAKQPDKNLRLLIAMNGMGGMNAAGMGGGMMHGANRTETITLMGVEMTYEQAVEHCAMMPGMAGCEPYLSSAESAEADHATAGGIEWEDTMAMMNSFSTNETIEWIIEDVDTKQQNEKIDWSFTTGDMVKIRIYNDPASVHPMQHPIHFHGQRFVVLATDGTVNQNLQWKDTALILPGQTVDVLVDMSNPGNWMAHCHIAEHLHSGMMFQFKVE
ncbi:multicopper oxidase family protein [Candidatus Kaiserbacteria bacterium]|nr:multicopper oxidase family protein [Candidatus Kaiserbacteria bacterium]